MGAAGRTFAAGYDWDVLARRQAELYRSTVTRPRTDDPPRRRRDLIARARS
jgi:glycogen(starch) synthase